MSTTKETETNVTDLTQKLEWNWGRWEAWPMMNDLLSRALT